MFLRGNSSVDGNLLCPEYLMKDCIALKNEKNVIYCLNLPNQNELTLLKIIFD